VYQELLELQLRRYRSQPAKQAFHGATALKLQGNVHVALKQFAEARQCYQAALKQYRMQCGAESAVVLELEQRMHEVQQYTVRH
jgi:catechol-2,3-dioxygenase